MQRGRVGLPQGIPKRRDFSLRGGQRSIERRGIVVRDRCPHIGRAPGETRDIAATRPKVVPMDARLRQRQRKRRRNDVRQMTRPRELSIMAIGTVIIAATINLAAGLAK